MGFFRGVFDDRHPLSTRRGEHDVDRRSDTHEVEIYPCSGKTVFGVAADHSAGIVHFRAEETETLYMLVYGSGVKRASAGKPYGRFAESAEQSTDQIIRRSHFANAVRHGGNFAAHSGTVDNDSCPVFIFHGRPDLAQDLDKSSDVADIGDVFDSTFSVHEHGGGDDRDRGVFRAADGYFSVQAFSAADCVSYQKITPAFGL